MKRAAGPVPVHIFQLEGCGAKGFLKGMKSGGTDHVPPDY